MRTSSAIAALGLLPALSWGQGEPGTNLQVDVRVTRVEVRQDATRVEYMVRNHPESAEPLFEFRVEAPSPVLSMSSPDPVENWTTSTVYRGLSIAGWAMLETQLAPGAEAGPLGLEALGLPTIVTSYASGWFPVPAYAPLPVAPSPPSPPRDVLLASSVPNKTVGIEPFPGDLSPAALLDRLAGFLDAACGDLEWITSAGVCHSLQVKLGNASRSLGQGQLPDARGQLGAFLQELEAQHGPEPGKHVTDNAFWLLRANAGFLLSRLS